MPLIDRPMSEPVPRLTFREAASPTRDSLTAAAPPLQVSLYGRGGIICRQGDPAGYIFELMSGIAIRHFTRADGRRQIMDLLLPGDFFGFAVASEYCSTAESICNATAVASYRREQIQALMSPGLWRAAVEALARLENHIRVTGGTTACEKVGTLLLELEKRLSNQPRSLMLPVSRYDMADYLAISVETVSRALGNLHQQGVIRLSGPRAVKILDPEALEAGESRKVA